MSHTPFHLALPVDDLEAAAAFYGGVLACPQGRSSPRWIDYDFYGHQLVVHKVPPEALPPVARNPVDGESVPAAHFGAVLSWAAWDALQEASRRGRCELQPGADNAFCGPARRAAHLLYPRPGGQLS